MAALLETDRRSAFALLQQVWGVEGLQQVWGVAMLQQVRGVEGLQAVHGDAVHRPRLWYGCEPQRLQDLAKRGPCLGGNLA